MATIQSVNPSTYEVLGEVEVSSPAQIASAVKNARNAQQAWYDAGIDARVSALRKVFDGVEADIDALALLQAQEVGMPITQAIGDIKSAVHFSRWYFDNAARLLEPQVTLETDDELHYVVREPLGVVAVITPWNFPINNIVWGGLQSLIAGNTIVLKVSEECPLSGQYFEKAFTKHLPSGVFNQVYGDGIVGEQLANDHLDMITFTGSTKTGRKLYEIAARKFIPATLELGGSAPAIVWPDTDLVAAATEVCDQRLYNAGQCCDGLKRLIVHEDVYDEVVEYVTKSMSSRTVGNAVDANTNVGPLAAKRQLDLLMQQIEDAVDKGATVATGGDSLEAKMNGAFVQLTVLTNVTPDMRVWSEEVFGPVLPIIKFSTDEEAIALANDTSYGLGAYLFTQDKQRAMRVANAIKSGMVSINGTSYIHPFNPFGGYKGSGIGREHGQWGFDGVTQAKVIASPK